MKTFFSKLKSSSDTPSGSSDGATASYQRLPEEITSLAVKQELTFYNDDGTSQTVLVERDLCASDLCQLLALKNRVAKYLQWTIVEHWAETGLERCLEDHEKVLEVHRFMENNGENRFVFRKYPKKYEVFVNPRPYFPLDMLDFPKLKELTEENREKVLQDVLSNDWKNLRVVGNLWAMDQVKPGWDRMYLILRHEVLYITEESSSDDECPVNLNKLRTIGMVANFNIYTTLNAKNKQNGPTEFGIILRSPDKEIDAKSPSGQVCLTCRSEEERSCWLIAMRLVKYGRQLKENYLAYKNKSTASNVNQCSSLSVPDESVRSRVAMDFTGSVGRIVVDPREVRAIEAAEGINVTRMWRHNQRNVSAAAAAGSASSLRLVSDIHITQPWFYSGMSRERATQLVNRPDLTDGVFLVRESRSNQGVYVLTYRCDDRVYHQQIQPIMDQMRNRVVYTLDQGTTRFWDLLQLIEFYQLNTVSLLTRLTHYVVLNSTRTSPAVRN